MNCFFSGSSNKVPRRREREMGCAAEGLLAPDNG
jgi:hypothetical protein